jgi:hypothetical protein
MAMFTSSQLRAIPDALADTTEGLTGSEISHFLSVCGMIDTEAHITKRHRLYAPEFPRAPHGQRFAVESRPGVLPPDGACGEFRYSFCVDTVWSSLHEFWKTLWFP